MSFNNRHTQQNLRTAQREVEKHPDSPAAWRDLALTFLEADLLAQAVTAYHHLRGLERTEAAHQAVVAVERACETYVTAEATAGEVLTEMIADDPELAGVPLRLLGLMAASRKDWNGAYTILERAREADPDDAETYYWLGESAFQLGQLREAWAFWEACLQRDPGHDRAKRGVATVNQASDSLGPSSAVEVQRGTVSACLIVKNEAADLRRCLESLRGHVDEIVVVDTGSTDETVAIAESYGAIVGQVEWSDDFSAARNASLELATSDWVLVIDADEELVLEDAEAFRAALQDSEAKAYQVTIENVGQPWPLIATRCFRRYPGFRYAGRVYEELPILKELRLTPSALPGARLRHLGHQPEVLAASGKAERNRRLAEMAAERQPKDPKSWFHLANACWLARDTEGVFSAAAQIRRLQDYGRHLEPALRQAFLLVEAQAQAAAGQQAQAVATLEEGLAKFPEARELKDALERLPAPDAPEAPEAPETPEVSETPEAPRSTPRVSACLIVKNEAKNLRRCLDSLRGHVDEIVVMDTGSTDETVAIAESYGATIGHFTWIDDFSAARNAALALATADWVLVVDADHELEVRDVEAYRAALADPEAVAYAFDVENLDMAGRVSSRYRFQPRLFRLHRGLAFTGRLHEDIYGSLRQQGLDAAFLPAVVFRHHGYTEEALDDTGKISRNRRIADLVVAERPDDVEAWHHVAASRWLDRDLAGALEAITRVEELRQAGHTLEAAFLRQHLLVCAWVYTGVGQPAQAIASLDEGLRLFPGFPEYHFERGRLRAAAGDVAGAIADLEACVAPTDQAWHNLRAGVAGYYAHTELMSLYAQQGDMAKAAHHARAASEDPSCPPAEATQLLAMVGALSAVPEPAPTSLAAEREHLLADLRTNPRNADGFLGLALSLYQDGIVDKALLAVGQAIELNAGQPASYYMLGLILSALGQPAWAEKAFATTLQLDPDHPMAQESRLLCRSRQAEYPLSDEQAAALSALLRRVNPTVTACMIVRDEAENLERCLAALKEFVDEVVVIDVGSTDETVARAEAVGAKVGRFQWNNDIAAARNAPLELATSEWILMINPDEVLEVDHHTWMTALRNRQPGGYSLAVQRRGESGPTLKPRLFQRHPEVRYEGQDDVSGAIARLGREIWPLPDARIIAR